MSVRQAQMQISSAEFTEWMAYYEIEPFGDLVADQRHGVATSLIANLKRDAKTRPNPYMPDDFIHWRAADGAEQDEEPVLLDDPAAHSNLIRAVVFGQLPK